MNGLVNKLAQYYLQTTFNIYNLTTQPSQIDQSMEYVLTDHFLNIAGLTRFHATIISWSLVAAILILTIVWALRKFAIFHQVTFQQQLFKETRIIYFNHRGPYDSIGNAFQRGKNIFTLHFKISKMFGIYYDNPQEIGDKAMCRSTIGILINQGELHKVDQFFKAFPSFQTTVLPRTPCISTRYPYVNILSIFLIVAKVYPRMQEYIIEKEIRTGPFMQIYHLLSECGGNQVEVMAPLEKINSFMLWEDDNEPIAVRKRD